MLPYFRSMEAFFDLSLPKSWADLSDPQLLFFFRQLATDKPWRTSRACRSPASSHTANILSAWDSLANSDRYRRLYQRIFAIEFSILRVGEYPIPSIIDIVNSIRLAKGNVFAEWKQSDTAKLFADHGYKNKKQAGGYFF